jgi:hypothetical protein
MSSYGPPSRRLVEGAVRYRVHPARFLPRRYRPEVLEKRHWWAILVFPTKEALNDYGSWRGGEEDRDFFWDVRADARPVGPQREA